MRDQKLKIHVRDFRRPRPNVGDQKSPKLPLDLTVVILVFLLTYLPEPLYLFCSSCVVPIYRVPLPLIDINLLHTTQHELEEERDRKRQLNNIMKMKKEYRLKIDVQYSMCTVTTSWFLAYM